MTAPAPEPPASRCGICKGPRIRQKAATDGLTLLPDVEVCMTCDRADRTRPSRNR